MFPLSQKLFLCSIQVPTKYAQLHPNNRKMIASTSWWTVWRQSSLYRPLMLWQFGMVSLTPLSSSAVSGCGTEILRSENPHSAMSQEGRSIDSSSTSIEQHERSTIDYCRQGPDWCLWGSTEHRLVAASAVWWRDCERDRWTHIPSIPK